MLSAMDASDVPPPDHGRMGFLRWLVDPLILPRQGENPLADYTLGRSPKSPRRARRALVAAAKPLLIFVCFIACIIFMLTKRHIDIDDSDEWALLFAGAQASTALVVISGLLFQSRALRSLCANWSDYRMAGLTSRQILVGLAAPGLRSARVSFFCFGLIALLQSILILPEFDQGLSDTENFAVLTLSSLMMLDIALWIQFGHTLAVALSRNAIPVRVTGLLLIPLSSGPALIALGLYVFIRGLHDVFVVIWMTILALLLRPVIVAALWHRAINWLETDGP